MSSSGGNSVTLNFAEGAAGSPGQYSTGTFVANSGSQAFTFAPASGSVPAQINAIQLRDVTNIGWWNGASTSWDTATSNNFNTSTGTSAGTFSQAIAVLPSVYFADSKTLGGAAVGTSNVNIAAGGVTGADVFFINNSVGYTLTSSDTKGITGTNSVWIQGNGAVTMNGSNSYSGGTYFGSGQLNINVGGNATFWRSAPAP